MKAKNVWKSLRERADQLAAGIEEPLSHAGLQLTRCESLFWIHPKTQEQPRSLDKIPADQSARFNPFFLKLLDRGIYLAPNAYEVGFLSYAHSADIIFKTCEGVKKALDETK